MNNATAPASVPPGTGRHPLQRFLSTLGPGLITGAADDDPSGIATYSQAGAAFGFGFLWAAIVTFPLMVAVQLMCGRIGIVARRGLASVLRTHYPRWVLWIAVALLFIANTVNIAADLGAMAASVRLITGGTGRWIVAIVAAMMLALIAYGSYASITKWFKWLTLMLFSYVGAAILSHPNWYAVLGGTAVPHIRLTRDYLFTFLAILGTTISPYLFFWQTAQTAEGEATDNGTAARRAVAKQPTRRVLTSKLRLAQTDVLTGMALSNAIMYFIIVTAGATLHAAGQTDIQTAEQAAAALRPLAGRGAGLLFALGIIGTGALAVPVLAGSAAYAIAEAGAWRGGLGETPRTAGRFYSVLAVIMGLGVALTLSRINAIKLLVWSAVVNGLLAPPLIVMLLLVCNNPSVMGGRLNGWILNTLGVATAVLMTGAAVALIVSWIT